MARDETRVDSTFIHTEDPEKLRLENNFVLLKLFMLVRSQRGGLRIGSLGFAVVMAVIANDELGHWAWLLACLPVVGAEALREWAVRRHIPGPDEHHAVHAWFTRVWIAFAISSLTLASFLLLFSHLSDPSRGLITLLLLSLVTGSVSVTAGHPRLFQAFALPIVVPLATVWMVVPGQHYNAMAGLGVGLLVFASFMLMLWGYSRTAWQLFNESCLIRFRERELNERLRDALDDARQASQAKTRFLAAASHDLRQPLHVISLVTGALKLRQLEKETADMVALLDRVSTSLNAQLNSLLDISKLDAGLIRPRYQRVDVAEFMGQCFETFAPLAREKGLEPVLRLDTHATVVTDPALLQRMVTNLCQNALKYTAQGRIVLSATDKAENVILSVADTGCGIDPQHQASVFHEFVQVGNPERDASQGLGLGLSIVQRVARLLGIDVRLVSSPGVGTDVSLSIERAEGEAPLANTQAAATPPRADWIHLGLTVLVVDDDPTVRQSCQMLLHALGCIALLAEDLAQARKLTVRDKPDVLLVDLRLRGSLNGIEVINDLRNALGPVPALLISGDTAPDRLAMAHEAGLRMCHKPLTAEQLMTELARIQNHKAQPDEPVSSSGNGPRDSSFDETQLPIPFDTPPHDAPDAR